MAGNISRFVVAFYADTPNDAPADDRLFPDTPGCSR
jgi:hypothetical protein